MAATMMRRTAIVLLLQVLQAASSSLLGAAAAADEAATATAVDHASSSTSCARRSQSSAFSPVFAFGDSTTDTGNNPTGASSLPYGSTYFHRPTGRYSDGRLMLDFLCQALGVPFLPAHLRLRAAGGRSENFAVAGATALDTTALARLAGVGSSTRDSLDVQTRWFMADTARTAINMSHALVYLGEIGGNDYNYVWSSGKSASAVAALVPAVVQKVASQLELLVSSSGIKKVVVQGQFPMGCMATYLSRFPSLPKDRHGCIAQVSAVSDGHNQLLTAAIRSIAARHPDVDIVYLDTSAAYLHVLDHASEYGFTNTRGACFPRYVAAPAAASSSPCPNPRSYMSWDGIHLTDAMYGAMMGLMLHDNSRFASPSSNFLGSAAVAAACRNHSPSTVSPIIH